jgi:phosphate transport system permease protein
MVGLMLLAVAVAVAPLFFILADLVIRGAGSLSFEFFTRDPVPAGETGGGVRHAIVGTLLIVGMARISRFVADVMNGTPSIVVGVFAWTLIVARYKQFSAIAGAAALAMLMVPMVMRTTEELVKLVPHSLREAALALGYPRWRTSLVIVLRTALPGIVTGVLVAVARIAGETAPLLFTTLGSQFLSFRLHEPMAALPLTVYTYAIGPYEEWHQMAWAAALVLIFLVLLLSVAARLATRRRFGSNA